MAPVLLLAVLVTLLGIAWWITVPAPQFEGQTSIESFGESGDGPGQFNEPTGIALGLPGSFNGWFNVVSSIDLTSDGESILAVDLFNQRIQRFGPEGELLAIYPVAEPEAKRSIMGIAAASTGTVWLTNLGRNRIERWRLRD